MIKRAYWIFLLLVPMWAGALGLQGISVTSFIGQPLDARIELTALNGNDIEDIHVSLASDAEFQLAGLEYSWLLSSLRFNPTLSDDGGAYIHVTSSSFITEPALNFLVRVRWRSGALLKEYAILLDPPTYHPVVASASASAGNEPRPDDTGADTRSAAGRWQNYGPVKSSETLWVIATRTRPDKGVSVEQMMMALQRANPTAFRRGNINLLRQGVVLKVPDRAFMSKFSKREARAAFQQQMRDWRAWRATGSKRVEKPPAAGGRLDRDTPAPGRGTGISGPVTGEVPITNTGDARLQIVESGAEWKPQEADEHPSEKLAPGDEKAQLKQAIEESRNDLVVVKAINSDLKELNQVLEARIEALRRVLNTKERAIAELKDQPGQASVGVTAGQDAGDEVNAVQEQKKSPGTVSTAARIIQDGEKSPAQPVKPPETVDYFAWVKSYWLQLVVVAVLLLVLLLAMLARNRGKSGELPNMDAFGSYTEMEDTRVVENGVVAAHTRDKGEMAEGSGDGDEDASLFLGPGRDVASALTEADIYLAYRRYSQAESLMKEAIRLNPDSWVLKAKLLEIYAFRKDKKRFTQLLGTVAPAMELESPDIWAKVVELGRTLIPAHPLIIDAQLPEEIAHAEFGGGNVEVPADGLHIHDQEIVLDEENLPTWDFDSAESDQPDRKN